MDLPNEPKFISASCPIENIPQFSMSKLTLNLVHTCLLPHTKNKSTTFSAHTYFITMSATQYAWILTKVSKVDKPWHIIILILNIILPGVGTIIAAFMDERNDKNMVETLLIGVAQLLLSVFLVGWIFSIVWGYLIFQRSSGLLSIV